MASMASTITEAAQAHTPINDSDREILPQPWLSFVCLLIPLAILTAVGGNLLIMLSYKRDALLRNVHNLYLLHLAVCDFCIGSFSMSFYFIYTVFHWKWYLGALMCKLYLAENFTMGAMSTIVIVLFAWDRLAVVNLGASYSRVQTKRWAYVKLAAAWIFSTLLYSPAILFWDVIRGSSINKSNTCDPEFEHNLVFVLITTTINFLIPVVALSTINTMLFVAVKRITKAKEAPVEGQQHHHQKSQTGGPLFDASPPELERRTRQSVVQFHSILQYQTPGRCTNAGRSANASRHNTNCSATDPLSQPATTLTEANQTSSLPTANPSATSTLLQGVEPILQSPNNSFQTTINLFTTFSTFQEPLEIQPTTNLFTATSLIQEAPEIPSEIPIATSPLQPTTLLQKFITPPKIPTPSSQRSFEFARSNTVSPGAPRSPEIPPATSSQPLDKLTTKTSLSPEIATSFSSKAQGFACSGKRRRERRLLVILMGLVVALIIFWLPYNVASIINATCKTCVDKHLCEALTWLVWFKSCVNPFIYAYNSQRFRSNFRYFLSRVLPARLLRTSPSRLRRELQAYNDTNVTRQSLAHTIESWFRKNEER